MSRDRQAWTSHVLWYVSEREGSPNPGLCHLLPTSPLFSEFTYKSQRPRWPCPGVLTLPGPPTLSLRHRGSSCSVPPWVQLGVPTAFIQRKAQPGQSVCWDHRLSLLSFLGHGRGADRPCLSGGPTLSPCLSPTCPRPFSSLLPAAVFFPALSPQPMRAHLTQYLK